MGDGSEGSAISHIVVASLTALILSASAVGSAAPVNSQLVIRDVRVSKPFFSPVLDQKIGIQFSISQAGTVSVIVLDRDGFPVRELRAPSRSEAGPVTLEWNGRSDAGDVIPDEAYSLKIDFTSDTVKESYFPANEPAQEVSVKTNYYDRRGAILSYRLEQPARVHIQAGIATTDSKTRVVSGPVLKTLVNREPRPAGAVVENWNGFDDRTAIYIPALAHFVVAIAATALPENAMIANGNRDANFLRFATARKGSSLFTTGTREHGHHRGLAALDDIAPKMVARLSGAEWDPAERSWISTSSEIRVSASLEGPSAESFQRQPGSLQIFLDERRVAVSSPPLADSPVVVSLRSLKRGKHVLAVNWASEYGPVAVDCVQVTAGEKRLAAVSKPK